MRTHVLLTVNNPLAKLTSLQWDICQQHILCPHPTFSPNMQKQDFLRLPLAGILGYSDTGDGWIWSAWHFSHVCKTLKDYPTLQDTCRIYGRTFFVPIQLFPPTCQNWIFFGCHLHACILGYWWWTHLNLVSLTSSDVSARDRPTLQDM